MNTLYFRFVFIILLFSTATLWSQDNKPIRIENSDFLDISEKEVPGAIVLTGNVIIVHEGVRMTCNKAYHFTKSNFVKIFGNVNMVQGDTLFMNSKYAEYNGNTKFAYATGDVVMRDPKMTLATDTINFDRNSQQAYYNSKGTIQDPENTLVSNSGKYYLNEKIFIFSIIVLMSNHKKIATFKIQ